MKTLSERQQAMLKDDRWQWGAMPFWLKVVTFTVALPTWLAMLYFVIFGSVSREVDLTVFCIFLAVCLLQMVYVHRAFNRARSDG